MVSLPGARAGVFAGAGFAAFASRFARGNGFGLLALLMECEQFVRRGDQQQAVARDQIAARGPALLGEHDRVA